jgi:hypothetical protein
MQVEDGSHTPGALAFICRRSIRKGRALVGAQVAYMPAPPDRACRWNDLEASWSFYSRDQRSVISNQERLLMGLGDLENIKTRLGIEISAR